MKKIFTGLAAILALTLSACDTLTDLTTASNNKPVINSFDYSPKELNNKDERINFTVVASDRDKKDILEYKWNTTKGTLSSNTGEVISWSPLKANGNCDFENSEGISTVSVLVSDGRGGTTTGQTNIRVEKGCKSGGTIDNSTVVNTTKPIPTESSSPSASPSTISTPSAVPSVAPKPTTSPSIIPNPSPSVTPTLSPVSTPEPKPTEVIVNPVATAKPAYSPAKISFVKLEIEETSGNGDNIANRGENIEIKSYFTNSGGVNSNKLKIVASSTSSFVKINNIGDSLEALKPNEDKSVQYYFRVEISKTIPAGTEIPLSYKLSDDFGNEYSTTGSFTVQ